MKSSLFASAMIATGLIPACGTRKHEKKVPVIVEAPAQENNPQAERPQEKATPAPDPFGLLVVLQNSWLNPVFNDDGSVLTHEGTCLQNFTAGAADLQSVSRLDMNLNNMALKSGKAHCRMQLQLEYKKGYAFAIRKIEVPLVSRIPVDSEAVFEGFYGFKGKKKLVVSKALDSRLSANPLRLDYTALDQDIVWSGCSGQTTLVVDTDLSVNSTVTDPTGDLRIEGNSPYRLEVVWAKCQ